MRLMLFGLGLLTTSGPVLACVYPLPFSIPGESQASWNVRQERFIRAWQESGSRAWQRSLYDGAARISLARVVARRDGGGLTVNGLKSITDELPFYEADLLPLASLKGPFTPSRVTVRHTLEMQCRFVEPGAAARTPVGSLVILFDGFAAGPVTAPDGFPVTMARDPRLLAALAKLPAHLKRSAP